MTAFWEEKISYVEDINDDGRKEVIKATPNYDFSMYDKEYNGPKF